MTKDLSYVRRYYGVPAEVGRRVKCVFCHRLILLRRTDGRLRVHVVHGRSAMSYTCIGSEMKP